MGSNFCCHLSGEKTELRIEKNSGENYFYSKSPLARADIYAQKKILSKNMFYIIKIQSFFRLKLAQQKFKNIYNLYLNFLKSEFKANYVENVEEKISSHQGEIFSKILDEEYGKYIPSSNYSKYSIYFKALYINKNQTEDFYIGYWNVNKQFNGYGILYKEDGSKYEGIWQNGKLNGKGRYCTNNGDFYIGDFLDGLANGEGIFSQNNGNLLYKGSFKDDLRHGNGEEIYKDDGSIFNGEFYSGKKIKGKFQWKDGSYYIGEFNDDKFSGNGCYYWKEGRVYNGTWLNGQMNGKGLFTYLNGSFYEGEFHNGLRNGYGKYVWNEFKTYEGYWLQGKQHGKGKYIKKDKIIEGVWINGKLKVLLNSNCSVNSGLNNGGIISNNVTEYSGTYSVENCEVVNTDRNKK